MSQEKTHFSLIGLFQILKKTMDEESATAIVQAFEEFSLGHYENSSKLATKEDLKVVKEDLKEELKHYATKEELINIVDKAKWQVVKAVIGTGFFAIILTILAHHFGY